MVEWTQLACKPRELAGGYPAEAKSDHKVLAVAVDEEDEIENVLCKFNLQNAVCVCAHNALPS